MSTSIRLGLLAFSAGVAALVVAVILPYTDPESLAALARHPVGARALNITNAAIHKLARLLEGVSASEAAADRLRRYYPLPAANASAASGGGGGSDLDWSDPEVWRLQQQQISGPFYTDRELDKLLHWCGGDDGGAAATAEAAAQARFQRLAQWLAANGGDASNVQLGVDREGVRGLYAARSIAAREVALAVPLKTGLSTATFRAARALAGPTAAWRAVEDADLFLDALAVSYEVAVHGERSPWADYLCLLPRSYGGLPVHISDPRVASLLSELPTLRRLAAKRRAQLGLFGEDLARSVLAVLPGGRSALARLASGGGGAASGAAAAGGGGSGRGDLWLPLWHWAYAAAKTRSVTLAAEEVRHGGGGAPPGEGGLSMRLPLALLDWVQEFGVMLPVLDLANHAFDGRGANVAYQLLPDASGSGLCACLVALEPLAPGQPLLFDYVASAESEQGPACVDRWLLEYGFVPDTASDPARDCDAFDVTAADVARAVLRAAAAPTAVDGATGQYQQHADSADAAGSAAAPVDVATVASLEAEIRERLLHRAKDGLPARLEIHVRQPYGDGTDSQGEHVVQRRAVLQWLKAALWDKRQEQEMGLGGSSDGGGRKTAAIADIPNAQRVLRALLQERLEQLGRMEQRVGDAVAGGVGGGADSEVRMGLAAVATAGRRAVQRALLAP